MATKPPLGSGQRFAQLKSKLAAKGATNPAALAAYIGRKKYGKKKFQSLSKNALAASRHDEFEKHEKMVASCMKTGGGK